MTRHLHGSRESCHAGDKSIFFGRGGGGFCYLNSPCIRKSITLMFMSSISCFHNKTQGHPASGRHVGASQMDTDISPNISKMKNCTVAANSGT